VNGKSSTRKNGNDCAAFTIDDFTQLESYAVTISK